MWIAVDKNNLIVGFREKPKRGEERWTCSNSGTTVFPLLKRKFWSWEPRLMAVSEKEENKYHTKHYS